MTPWVVAAFVTLGGLMVLAVLVLCAPVGVEDDGFHYGEGPKKPVSPKDAPLDDQGDDIAA